MIDRIILRPPMLFLNSDAVSLKGTAAGFRRDHRTHGRDPGGHVVLSFRIDRYAPIKVVGKKLSDGRWWVRQIEIVLPAVLHGHNGRPLRTAEDLALGLTIVEHVVRRLIEPEGHGRIIPGTGRHNIGYIDHLECMVQVRDPGHAFLRGSQLARLRNQQRGTRIYLGESSYLSTREMAVSIYDKNRQLRDGFLDPSDVEVTRIEAILKDPIRLGKEVKGEGLYAGKPGELVRTINAEAAFAILVRSLRRMTGVGWGPTTGELKSLGKTARLIAVSLGDRVGDPRQVDIALSRYKLSERPSPNTLRGVEIDLRSFAHRVVIRDPFAVVPTNLADLDWIEVKWPVREMAWATLLRDIGAPTAPDPEIAAAWAETTMHRKPCNGELTGPIAHSPLPFLTNSL